MEINSFLFDIARFLCCNGQLERTTILVAGREAAVKRISEERKKILSDSRRIVIKLGTAVLMRDEGGIALSRFYSFVEGIAALKNSGKEVLLVTSGAIGLGVKRLNLEKRPKELPLKQACAAVGQGLLMSMYADAFEKLGITTAQVLLTEDDFANRKRYLNLRSTIAELLRLKVLPIVNENDTVSTAELELIAPAARKKVNFGDNDKLSALVAGKVDADLLVIITDVEGLYTADPRTVSDAKLIDLVRDLDELDGGSSESGEDGSSTGHQTSSEAGHEGALEAAQQSSSQTGHEHALEAAQQRSSRTGHERASGAGQQGSSGTGHEGASGAGQQGSSGTGHEGVSETGNSSSSARDRLKAPAPHSTGRGGIRTKLEAARVATQAGCACIIASGKQQSIISRIFAEEPLGTLFLPKKAMGGKLRWIAFATSITASIQVNGGAKEALVNRKASLLAAGVTQVEGSFKRGDVVGIIDESGKEFARGIVNYNSDETRLLSGKHSHLIDQIVENRNYDAIVTRDNIAFLGQ